MTSLSAYRPLGRLRRLLFVGVFASLGYWIHFWPTFHAANESIRLYFIQAVVDHGTASVDEPRQRYRMSNVDKAHYNGHDYMDKAPGLSFLAMPVYWVATRLFGASTEFPDLPGLSYLLLLVCVVLPGTLGAYAVYTIIRERAGPDPRESEMIALFGAALVGVATPYALYCTLFFGHGPVAAFGAMSFALLQRHRVAAGFLAGYMVLIDTPTAVLAVALGLTVLVRTRSVRAMVEFGLGGMPPVAAQLAYNAWIFGSPFTFAYAFKASGDLATIHSQGLFGFSFPTFERLFGLSFGTERGLFFHAPALLLGLFAGRRGLVYWVISLVYFFWIAAFVDWQAGASYAPRHLIPIIPILGIPAALSLVEYPRLRLVAPALLAYSALMAFSMISTFPYAMIPFTAPVIEQALPLLAAGTISPNVLGLNGHIALLVPVSILVIMSLLFAKRQHVLSGFIGVTAFLALSAAPTPTQGPQQVDSLSRAAAFSGYPEIAARLCHNTPGYRWNERAWACTPVADPSQK